MRILIPFTSAKKAPARLWSDTAPLLKKECNLGSPTLVSDLDRPFFGHGPSPRTALSTDNGPVDSVKIDTAHGPQQRFERHKLHRRPRSTKMLQPHSVLRVFDGDA